MLAFFSSLPTPFSVHIMPFFFYFPIITAIFICNPDIQCTLSVFPSFPFYKNKKSHKNLPHCHSHRWMVFRQPSPLPYIATRFVPGCPFLSIEISIIFKRWCQICTNSHISSHRVISHSLTLIDPVKTRFEVLC